MTGSINVSLLIAPFLFAAAGTAGAATMEFARLPDEGALLTSYTEKGITATAGSGTLGFYTAQHNAHIDDSGTGFTSDVTFTTGGMFDAASFSITSLGFSVLGPFTPPSDTISVTGYSGGSLVAGVNYTLSAIAGTVQTFTLGSAFSMIDAFTISLLYPAGIADCDAPCSHFDLNWVTLDAVTPAPVPLPSSMALMASGLALIGLGRRRFRRKG